MRIYSNFLDMYRETEREIRHNGVVYQTKTVQDKYVEKSDDFKTKELQGYSFMVKETNILEFVDFLKLNKEWINEDFNERVSGLMVNPGEAWKLRSKTWREFLHDGKFSYTYSDRIGAQIDEVISHLKEHPNSRHAVITIYDRWKDHNNRGGKARVPCSMFYQFLIRNGKLEMIYNMRSSDFSEHFGYDLVLAAMLKDLIAKRLGVESGSLTFFTSSLHVFYKDNKEIF